MEERISQLESEIKALKVRNRRVEAEKAWEGSWCRALSIIVTTYLIATAVLYLIGVANPLTNALVPTVGYFLSTLTLPALKRKWIAQYNGGKHVRATTS